MMSQNRQANKDRTAAAHDYEVNLKAELELMQLHDKFDALRQDELVVLVTRQSEQIDRLVTLLTKRRDSPAERKRSAGFTKALQSQLKQGSS